jgi:hypothetical protein
MHAIRGRRLVELYMYLSEVPRLPEIGAVRPCAHDTDIQQARTPIPCDIGEHATVQATTL